MLARPSTCPCLPAYIHIDQNEPTTRSHSHRYAFYDATATATATTATTATTAATAATTYSGKCIHAVSVYANSPTTAIVLGTRVYSLATMNAPVQENHSFS